MFHLMRNDVNHAKDYLNFIRHPVKNDMSKNLNMQSIIIQKYYTNQSYYPTSLICAGPQAALTNQANLVPSVVRKLNGLTVNSEQQGYGFKSSLSLQRLHLLIHDVMGFLWGFPHNQKGAP